MNTNLKLVVSAKRKRDSHIIPKMAYEIITISCGMGQSWSAQNYSLYAYYWNLSRLVDVSLIKTNRQHMNAGKRNYID